MLQAFWQILARSQKPDLRLVTYGGARWGLPFLVRRSLLLGLAPSGPLPLGRSKLAVHFDVDAVLANWDGRRSRPLELAALQYDLPGPWAASEDPGPARTRPRRSAWPSTPAIGTPRAPWPRPGSGRSSASTRGWRRAASAPPRDGTDPVWASGAGHVSTIGGRVSRSALAEALETGGPSARGLPRGQPGRRRGCRSLVGRLLRAGGVTGGPRDSVRPGERGLPRRVARQARPLPPRRGAWSSSAMTITRGR